MGEKRDTHCPGNNSEIMKKRRLQLKTKPRPIVSLGESYVSKVEGKEFIQMKKIYQDEKNMHDTKGKNNTHGRLLSLSPGGTKCFSHCSIGFVLMYT